MKKQIIIFLHLMISVSMMSALASAEPSFFVKVTPITSAISIDDEARFQISVYNNNTFDDTYMFFMKDDWTVGTDPTQDYWNGLSVPRKGTELTTVRLSTNQNYPVGPRPGIQLMLKSAKTGEEASAILNIEMLPRTKFPVDVSAQLSPDSPYYIDPRNKISLKVNIQNNNAARYANLKVLLKGKHISRSMDISLNPNENKIAEFTLDFDKMTSPGKDSLLLEVLKDDKIISKDDLPIEIIEYSEPFKRTESKEESFLKTKTTITLENDGNVAKQQNIKFQITSFQRYLTKADPKAEFDKTSGYAWDVMLKSGEKTQITIVKNMLPLLYLAIFILTYLTAYLVLRSPIIVIKEVTDITRSEGGISELKIRSRIKNRSGKPMKDVSLIERIPEITTLVPEKDAVKPAKQYKYKEGIALEWRFADIEPGEERIVTYRIKSRLVIMGGMRLKPSIVKFSKKKTFSRPVSVYTP